MADCVHLAYAMVHIKTRFNHDGAKDRRNNPYKGHCTPDTLRRFASSGKGTKMKTYLMMGLLFAAPFSHAADASRTLYVVNQSTWTGSALDDSEEYVNKLAQMISKGHVYDKVVRDFAYTPKTKEAKKFPKLEYQKGASLVGAYRLEIAIPNPGMCIGSTAGKVASTLVFGGLLTRSMDNSVTFHVTRVNLDGTAVQTDMGCDDISNAADWAEKGVIETVKS